MCRIASLFLLQMLKGSMSGDARDLAPSDYHMFPGLKKKQLKVRHSSVDAEVIAAAETWFDGQTF